MIRENIYNFIKKLLKLRVNYLIKKSYQVAEQSLRLGQGEKKLNYAVNFISNKTKLIPYFKNMLAEVLLEEFEKHKNEINSMIIREPIRI